MIIFEEQFDLNHKEKELVNFILGDEFPWFFQKTTNDNLMMMSHVLMNRHPENLPIRGVQNSYYASHFENIMTKICKKHDVKINNVLRMAINNTHHFPIQHGDIHTDHSFPHNNFIWYMNKFNEGDTYLFDEHKTLSQTIIAKQNKVAMFLGGPHAQGFCAPYENRIVFVGTFN